MVFSEVFYKNILVFSEVTYSRPTVYLIALLNFRLEGLEKELRTDVALMDMKRHTLFSDKVRKVFLQLPYFTKELDECEDIFERIIYVLKHMDILQRMPFLAQDAVFKRLSEIADVASLSKEERREYDKSLKHYRDTIAVMHGQWLEGHASGLAEGMEKGIEKAKYEDARQMKADNMPVELIAKYTGLTKEVIEVL